MELETNWILVTDKLPQDTDWYNIKTQDDKIKKSFFLRDIHGGTSWERLAKKYIVIHWCERPTKPPMQLITLGEKACGRTYSMKKLIENKNKILIIDGQ